MMKKLITLFAIGLLSGAVGAGWFTDTRYEQGYDLGVEEGYNSSLCSRKRSRWLDYYANFILNSKWELENLTKKLKLKEKAYEKDKPNRKQFTFMGKSFKGGDEKWAEIRELQKKIRNVEENFGNTTYTIDDSNVSREEYNDFRDGFKKGYKFGKTKCKIEE